MIKTHNFCINFVHIHICTPIQHILNCLTFPKQKVYGSDSLVIWRTRDVLSLPLLCLYIKFSRKTMRFYLIKLWFLSSSIIQRDILRDINWDLLQNNIFFNGWHLKTIYHLLYEAMRYKPGSERPCTQWVIFRVLCSARVHSVMCISGASGKIYVEYKSVMGKVLWEYFGQFYIIHVHLQKLDIGYVSFTLCLKLLLLGF